MKGQLGKQILSLIALVIAIILGVMLLMHAKDYASRMKVFLFGPPTDSAALADYYFDRMVDFLDAPKETPGDFSKKVPENAPCIVTRFNYDDAHPLSSNYFFTIDYEGPGGNVPGNKAYVLHLHVLTSSGFIDNRSVKLGLQSFRYRCAAIKANQNRPLVDLSTDGFACALSAPPAKYFFIPEDHISGMPFLQDYAQINDTTSAYYFSRYPSLYILSDSVRGSSAYFYTFDPVGEKFPASSKRDSLTRNIQDMPVCKYKKV